MNEIYCEYCRYRRRDENGVGYICTNPDGEYVGEWVLPDDFCDLFASDEE